MPAPPIAEDLIHWKFTVLVNGAHATFGIWMHAHPAAILTPAQLQLGINDWYLFTAPLFLDCMSSDASFITCQLTRGGINRAVHQEVLAPNAGAQPGGEPIGVGVGIYLQVADAGRGSGTRVHIPGFSGRFLANGAKLSGYGLQQLTFLCDAVVAWPNRLSTDWGMPVELVTASTRKNGAYLPVMAFTPVTEVRPTLRLVTCSRRQRASGGVSPP